MDKHSLVLYFMSLLFMTTALKIRDILVPPSVSLSNDDAIVLDCDYDVENDSTDLVVKWFHDDQPIYQWIMNHPPQAIGPFKDKVDLSYRASTNALTQFRAIKFKEPSLELAGVYKCVVFNFNAEDSKSKRMVVINKPSKIQMLQLDLNDDEDNESISIACSAFDVFPKAILNISFSGSNEFDNVVDESGESDDGLFNVTQIVTFKEEMFENITDFTCALTIPETDYYTQRMLTFVPGSVTTEPEPELSDPPVSESSYNEGSVSSLAPVWKLLLVATMATLFST